MALDLSLDPRILWFTFLASTATGIAFGLAPALQSARVDIVASLTREGGRAGCGRSGGSDFAAGSWWRRLPCRWYS